MADPSPLAGLLDRAARILNLVGELADAIRANEQSPSDETQRRAASAWKALLPAIVEVGESLPSDPCPIADWIREVGRVSKWFDGELRQHGLADVLFRFNCDGFIRVADEGQTLFREMAAKRDPFAFVEAPTVVNPLGIDTMPATPKPPIQFVEAAAREISSIMANVAPRHDGAIELVASHLAKRLQDARHTLAAAQWAVHESVRAGRLQPGLIEVEFPSVGRVVGGKMRHWGGRDDRRMEWSGGGKGTVGIPKGKPAPFDSFKVTATESLWTWWHSAAVESPNQAEPAIKAGEAFRRIVESDPETRAGWERARARLQAFAKAMQEAMESPEYKAAQEAERRRWQELADAIRANIQWAGNELTARHFARPETIEDWEHLTRIVELPAETIRTGNLTPREIFACALAWADRQTIKAKLAAETKADASDPSTPTKAKRSTERGEGRAKLIAALTKHHKYADGGCLNLEPIGNNELARLAGVDQATASAFFKQQFKGHGKYKTACADAGRLAAALKLLNGEFAPHLLYGSKPADEDERDEE